MADARTPLAELARRLDRRILACAAVASAMGGAAPLQADVIATTGLSYPVVVGTSKTVDIDGDGLSEIMIVHTKFAADSIYLKGAAYGMTAKTVALKSPLAYLVFKYVDNLDAGTAIGYSSVFDTGALSMMYSKFGYGEFSSSGGGPEVGSPTGNYIGVQFTSTTDGGVHFGWVALDLSGFTPTITGFAWESTPGTAITAGAVPEPTSAALALLALGAAGVRARRRARATAIDADLGS